MRFVETKTPEQQSCLMLHRTRQLFIRQQTSVINAIRAHLAEFGIVAPVGRKGVEQLLAVVTDARDQRVPELARACVAALGAQLCRLKQQILEFDRRILAWHRSNETSRRLDAIPGIGPALATALVASVANPKAFRSGRNFSAWIWLVPRQHSSGGKHKLGSISKQGDRYLRSLFTAGALAVIRYDALTANRGDGSRGPTGPRFGPARGTSGVSSGESENGARGSHTSASEREHYEVSFRVSLPHQKPDTLALVVSPPEAIFTKGFNGSPTLGETRNSTRSSPVLSNATRRSPA
jgi:hypothetical protein